MPPETSAAAPSSGDRRAARVPLVARPRPPRLPVSYAQRRLWFIDQLAGGRSTEYNTPIALRLRGRLDVDALRQAIQTITDRHESLRTHFAAVDAEPVQVISDRVAVEIPCEDAGGDSEDRQLAHVEAVLEQEWSTPFDLSRGPLVRLRLLRLGPDDHVLVRTCHHIVCDALSQRIFDREIRVLYEAFSAGRPNPLRPLPLQYADYVLWQRERFDEAALERDLVYWRNRLAGVAERMALPTDRTWTATSSRAAETHRTTIAAADVEALRRLCRTHRTTMYMTLLAALGVLLARYSGQRDVVVVSAASSRDAQLDDLIGMFLNQLPLRLCAEPRMAFNDVLQAVRASTVEAYDHQEVPFDRIVGTLARRRSGDTPPFLQVAFAFQNEPEPQRPAPPKSGLAIDVIRFKMRRVRGDLELQVRECDGAFSLGWIYAVALYDAWRIEQMARHFTRVVTSVAAAPDRAIGHIDLMDPEERQRCGAWNAATGSLSQ